MSIVWFGRFFGARIEERCNMTDAFNAFLEATDFSQTRAALVGLEPDEATIAARAMEARSNHLAIDEVCSGYLSEEEYRTYFSALDGIDLILVGMGTPRTERICRIASEACPTAVVWGIGAGSIRIFSGTMREAPPFMRKYGLQWLHRLLREPRLLWRRYLFGNPLFLFRMLRLALRRRQNGVTDGIIRKGGM